MMARQSPERTEADDMNREKRRKRMLIAAGIGMAVFVLLLILKLAWPAKEYRAVQSILENLPAYREELESWGYQVSVFDPVKDACEDTDEVELLPYALLYYTEGGYQPVLILTGEKGESWFFCHGFDQYAQETTETEWIQSEQEEEVLAETTTMLWLQKSRANRIPTDFHDTRRGGWGYYDMEVTCHVSRVSLETGERLHDWNGAFASTWYCSNNFEESKHFSLLDSETENWQANTVIKSHYSAKQLLEIYWQGIALQERLVELSRSPGDAR